MKSNKNLSLWTMKLIRLTVYFCLEITILKLYLASWPWLEWPVSRLGQVSIETKGELTLNMTWLKTQIDSWCGYPKKNSAKTNWFFFISFFQNEIIFIFLSHKQRDRPGSTTLNWDPGPKTIVFKPGPVQGPGSGFWLGH
jgi:hypothetical protein